MNFTDSGKIHMQKQLLLDIKPDNFLFTLNGEELVFRRILDYGSVINLEEQTNYSDMILSYTEEYGAPELVDGNNLLSPAADIYAFGKTVFAVLFGKTPADWLMYDFQPENPYISKQEYVNMICSFAKASECYGLLNQSSEFYALLHLLGICTMADYIAETTQIYNSRSSVSLQDFSNYQRCNTMQEIILILDLLLEACESEFYQPEELLLNIKKRLSQKDVLLSKTSFSYSSYLQPVFMDPSEKNIDSLKNVLDEDIWHQYFIVGESGSGKTVSLKALYRELLQDLTHHYIPVYISLADFLQKEEYENDLRQVIYEELFGQKKKWDSVEALIYEGRNRLVLLLDGMNEINGHKQYAQIVACIRELMQKPGIDVIITGQDVRKEFSEFSGMILRIQTISKKQADRYLNSVLGEVWGKYTESCSNLDALYATFRTAANLYYFSVTMLGIEEAEIFEKVMPVKETDILYDYIFTGKFSLCYSLEQAIQKEEIGRGSVRIGEFMICQVLGILLYDMAVDRTIYVSRQTVLLYLNQFFKKNAKDTVLFYRGNHYYVSTAVLEQIYSLKWMSLLFDSVDTRYRIIHERLRNYIACCYIKQEYLNNKKKLPDVMWSNIPDSLIDYLAMELSVQDIKGMCKVIHKRKGGIVIHLLKYMLDISDNLKRDTMFFLSDPSIAGNNIIRIIRSPYFACHSIKKIIMIAKTPKTLLKGPESIYYQSFFHPEIRKLTNVEKEYLGSYAVYAAWDSETLILWRELYKNHYYKKFTSCTSIYMEGFYYLSSIAAIYLQKKGYSATLGEKITMYVIGIKELFSQYSEEQVICETAEQTGIRNEDISEIKSKLQLSAVYKNKKVIQTVSAFFILEQMKKCNEAGILWEGLTENIPIMLLQTMGECIFGEFSNEDYLFESEYFMRYMLDKKYDSLFQLYHRAKIKGENPIWSMEKIFDGDQRDLKQRDMHIVYKQENFITIIKQYVIWQYNTQINQGILDEKNTLAGAQLYLMIAYSVNKGKLGYIGSEQNYLLPKCRIVMSDASLCHAKPELTVALIDMQLFDKIKLSDFLNAELKTIFRHRLFYLEHIKFSDIICLVILGLGLIYASIISRSPTLLFIVLALLAIFSLMKIILNEGAETFSYLIKMLIDYLFEFFTKK